jgi:hypothetical protein
MLGVMKTIICLVLLITALSVSANDLLVRYDGIGPIKFGMKLAVAESKLQEKALVGPDYSEECNYITFKGIKGVSFMVEDNLIVRADLESGIKNQLGVAVGDSLGSIKSRFPKAVIKPNEYDNESHDIWIVNPKGSGVILLTESGGEIQSIRAGIEPAVSYIEGCL